jgi:hypothetical protein
MDDELKAIEPTDLRLHDRKDPEVIQQDEGAFLLVFGRVAKSEKKPTNPLVAAQLTPVC